MVETIAQEIISQYMARTPRSRAHDASAKNYLPGGDTRISLYYRPYPSYMERGEGCYLYDADGNRYIDFLNNYTVLVHGHNHPAVVEAVRAEMAKGMGLGSAGALQYELARLICERTPSIDLIRFCNSGTEATMMAMRAARAFTGRDIIIKMDAGYHGTHDWAEINSVPRLAEGVPPVWASTPGVPACALQAMMAAPFNDLDIIEQMLKARGHEVAAVILEPLMGAGGGIRPLPGYLRGLAELTARYDVLLIFDEIITYRFGLGGLQSLEGVRPDLTCLGKIIGGGFAIGAFGGRRDIMERFSPASPELIAHAGTFNGHNVTMAAGVATLQHYGQSEIDRIGRLGERLTRGFNRAFAEAGIRGQAQGIGSMTMVHWTDRPLTAPAVVAQELAAVADIPALFHLEMMNHGIYQAPRGQYAVSTPMTESEIDQAVEACADTLCVLKPYIAEIAPDLLI